MADFNSFKADLLTRIRNTRTTRWVRFGIVALIFILWVVWMGSPWWALLLFLLFDIYITGYIPFTWWKKSKSRTVRTVMSWVDAIVYALILVYFIFNFVGQNYQIPSSSLEKTLLTGDYLWVNKLTYGPRVPMTPVHFPLVHNTLPIINTKSYLDWPSAGYKRLKGLRDVELNDIAVFNFPAGDTVALNFENSSEYYDLLVKRYGWKRVNTDRATFGEVIYRPVDRRVNFVKRVVGLPGQRIAIHDDVIYLDGKAQAQPENVQFMYFAAFSAPLDPEQCHELGIALEDVQIMNPDNVETAEILKAIPGSERASSVYTLPMTASMIETLSADGRLLGYVKWNGDTNGQSFLFPDELADNWTIADYGGENGILIPRKGMTVPLTYDNWLTYQRVIRNYEGHSDARWDGTQVVIEGKPAKDYTFQMDYYFMMGDNRHLSQDSRFWGFVPEDHIVGTPMMVLISFDKDRSIFNGGIRWNRILKDANPEK